MLIFCRVHLKFTGEGEAGRRCKVYQFGSSQKMLGWNAKCRGVMKEGRKEYRKMKECRKGQGKKMRKMKEGRKEGKAGWRKWREEDR